MHLAVDVARLSLRRAIEVRKKLAIPMEHAVSAVDISLQLDVEVWYKPLASLAGMYSGGEDPVIVIGSDRPAGYQASVCAHEIGHHMFGHGTRVDEYVEGATRNRSDDPEERLANLFGSHLLMPQAAVSHAFAARGWSMASPSAEQAFVVAGHLGVGYEALVRHLRWTILSIDTPTQDRLLRHAPKTLRAALTGRPTPENVLVVDRHWTARPVDLVVGDLALLPADTYVEGPAAHAITMSEDHLIIRATRRGMARAESTSSDWSSFIRVMPAGYDGAAVHRHLEDPDDS